LTGSMNPCVARDRASESPPFPRTSGELEAFGDAARLVEDFRTASARVPAP
jgi:hypothetical protein